MSGVRAGACAFYVRPCASVMGVSICVHSATSMRACTRHFLWLSFRRSGRAFALLSLFHSSLLILAPQFLAFSGFFLFLFPIPLPPRLSSFASHYSRCPLFLSRASAAVSGVSSPFFALLSMLPLPFVLPRFRLWFSTSSAVPRKLGSSCDRRPLPPALTLP